ncbi:MAG: SPOR domain-containing protein [Treponema sp.]|jgi:DedD protein|nr:SPOR domain-containing protein [Treponema sp.]
MEKKKLLLVAVSVGVFLVITISAAILIFTPRNTGSAVSMPAPGSLPPSSTGTPAPSGTESAGIQDALTQPRTQPASVDAADMVRNAGGIQGIQTPPQAQAIQENNFYINGDKPGEGYTIEKSGEGSNTRVVINVPKPSTAAVPDRPAGGRPPARQDVAPSRPAAVQARTKPAAGTAEKKPAAAPVKTYRDYWVQTGAFSAKVRAEGAKETLASKGISSIIENRDIDGKTWYRVRVGPYTSENEASYWLSLVKSIDGFADSQIRRSVRN